MNSSSSSKYPKNRDLFRSQNSNQPDVFGQAANEFLNECAVLFGIGCWVFVKSLFSSYAPLVLAWLGFITWAGYYISTEAIHFQLLHWSEPSIFTYERIQPLYKIHRDYWWAGISIFFFLLPTLITIGAWSRYQRTKYKHAFESIGLKNKIGQTPKLIKKKEIDKFRVKYIFDANNIGFSSFDDKKEELEAYFQQNIESIKYGKHKGRIEITLNKQDFPNRLTYSELIKETTLPANSFYIGYSAEGNVIQSVSELPHMIIAGTTGSGKSVFFKQALMGLLESTPHIQMYLVDLKGGLEMIDFVDAPNVKVVKTLNETLELFRQIEKEMKARFAYLEKSGRKQIIPAKDKKDRIVVAVDEASVLYTSRGPHDPDKKKALEARNLADSIAKLSRAASIHLLLATQKVEDRVIPTSVTENISGRMVFRVNSFQGSNQVIGSKEAMMLPEIPGRGIWSFGTRRMTIQAPFIGEQEIKKRCLKIAEDFENEERKCFHLMVGESEASDGKKKREAAYGNTLKSENKTQSTSSESQKDGNEARS